MNILARYCAAWLAGSCLAIWSGSSPAQTDAPEQQRSTADLPTWTVLALKPVGAKRVKPVTAVVVADGLVVVPADFVEPGDQIIVLDGGTDIIANGRAAKIRQQIAAAGLTVLAVPGLHRPPPTLAVAARNGEAIHLAAFPPAEQIAEGAAPVWAPTQVLVADGAPAAAIAIAPEKALPNVTGPLIDACGNLLGLSVAQGVQSMDTNRAPAYLWKDVLATALSQAGLSLAEAPCPAPADTAVESAATQSAAPGEEDRPAPASERATTPAGAAAAGEGMENSPSPVTGKRAQAWLLLLAAALLLGLLWLLFRRGAFSAGNGASGSLDGGTAEPPAAAQGAGLQVPQDAALSADCVVEVTGRMADGTAFARRCEVNGAAINLVIGRGDADIPVDSTEVHRTHARLSGSMDMLTISDLGSSRGTWINRVPCFKGEIMFISPEDTIFVGDVSMQVSIRTRPQTGAEGGP